MTQSFFVTVILLAIPASPCYLTHANWVGNCRYFRFPRHGCSVFDGSPADCGVSAMRKVLAALPSTAESPSPFSVTMWGNLHKQAGFPFGFPYYIIVQEAVQTVALHCLDTILCLKRTAAEPLHHGYSAARVSCPNKGLNLHVSLRPEFTFFITADFCKCFTTHAGATLSFLF